MDKNSKDFFDGAKKTLPIALSSALFGLSVGIQAEASGLTLTEWALMNFIVFAGASQAVALELWKAPLPLYSIILTTLFINIRHIPMGGALASVFKNVPNRLKLPSLFVMCDSSWAVTIEQQQSQNAASFSYFLGSGLIAYLCWGLSSVSGYLIGPSIPNPSRLGLDFTMTAIFIHIIVGTWRANRDLVPWMIAGVSSVISARFLPGTWYIVVGALIGSISAGVFMPRLAK